MKLDFLGTGSGDYRGSRRQPCAALLGTVLLDCGAGVTGRLYDIGRFDDVEAILISHLHTDHIAGLFDFLLHTFIARRTRPLTVLSPPGLSRILQAVYAAEATVKRPEELYPFRLVEGTAIEERIGAWTIRSVPLDHTVLDLGYHLSKDGLSVFFSGDTREPSAAGKLAADYLIHEATYPESHAHLAREYGHSTGVDAARTAAAMGARQLWLTHLSDLPGGDDEIASEARRIFPESVVAEDRSSYPL